MVVEETAAVVRIGAGSFATVFVINSRANIAFKQGQHRKRCPELQREFEHHRQIYNEIHVSFPVRSTFFSLVEPKHYYATAPEVLKDSPLGEGNCFYSMERVWPVPPPIEDQIRRNFFPENFKETEKRDFLARLYLGKLGSQPPGRFFSALNYPLNSAQLDILGLPTAKIALGMGELLARFHHFGWDARDVEFVLGGSGLGSMDDPGYFCIDLNQVRHVPNSVDDMVQAFYSNDPYYPRPKLPFYEVFKTGYINESVALGTDLLLYSGFLQGIERIADRSMDK